MPLVGKKLSLFCCTTVIKGPPPSSPPSDDALHRPILPSSWLPLYLKKFTSYNFLNPPVTSISALPSASTSDYEGDVEVEAETSSLDFSFVYSSPRFFVSSPGLSNSILDYSSSCCSDVVEDGEYVKGEVEVQRDSPDPYSDFRRSMEEMVEARELQDVSANWESLQELLRRYLSLNPEPNHKFIAGAFADLLVSLMTTDDSSV